jgi:outer membrane protein TolC
MRRTSLFIGITSLAIAVQVQGASLTRTEAVARALKANPIVERSREEMRGLEGRKREAIADALPDLKLIGTALRYRDPSLLNSSSFDSFPAELRDLMKPVPANLYEGTAQLHQTLYSFRLGGAIRAARHGMAMGRAQVRRAEQAVALDAVRAYNDLLLVVEKVRVAEKAVRQKERHLEMARNRRQAGVATDLDVLRSEVDLGNQRAQLVRVRGDADVARGALNAVMMRPIDEAIEPADRLDYLPFETPLDEVIQAALAGRPEMSAVTSMHKAYREFIGVARADGLPRLDFNALWGYSVREPKFFGDADYTRWNVSVSLTVPVFDGLRTSGRVMQARADAAKVNQDRLALENQIRLEAKAAFERLQTARTILEVAELNVTQAQKALDMTQANYGHGAATTLDVLDAQAALTLAESIRLEALHEHGNTLALLRFIMGRDPLGSTADGSASAK